VTNSEAIPNREIAAMVAAILSTLYATETMPGPDWCETIGVPSGPIYAALMERMGIDFDTYCRLIAFLEEKGLITQKAHLLQLTQTGKQLAERVEALARKH